MVVQLDQGQLQALIAQLTEADIAIQTLAGWEADAVLHPTKAAPTLLRPAQEHLWLANSRFERMQAAIASGTLLTSIDGMITSANQAACDLLGKAPAAILGRQYDDLELRMIDTAGALVPASSHPTMVALNSRQCVADVPMGLLGPVGGAVRWLLVSARPATIGSDAPVEIVTTLVDITSRVLAEQALSSKARQQEAVARLGQMALSDDAVDRSLAGASVSAAAVMNVELCSILELQPESHQLLLRAGVGWQPGLVGKATVGVGLESHADYTLQSNSPVVVNDIRTETRFTIPPLLRDHGVVSAVSVVIAVRGGPYGVIDAYTTQARTFTGEDINFLQAVANVLAAAIEHSRAARVIHDLSTPVLEIEEGLLLLPLIGAIGPRRASQIAGQLLRTIRHSRARVVVMDVTGVSGMDRSTANHLLRTIRLARVLGASVILTGISSAVARVMVSWRVNLAEFVSAGDLRSGIELGRQLLGRRYPMAAEPRDRSRVAGYFEERGLDSGSEPGTPALNMPQSSGVRREVPVGPPYVQD